MGRKIVIIGGVACGAKTAARLRRLDPHADITIIEKSDVLSYAGCGMPFYIEGIVKEYRELMSTPIGIVRDETFFRKVKQVTVLTRHLTTRIDRQAKQIVSIDLESGAEKILDYDILVLTTGASPFRPDIPGVDLAGVFHLWTMADAIVIKETLNAGATKKAIVVGSGLVGLEAVEALVANGVEVSVVEALDWPLATMVDKDFGALAAKKLAQKGVHFHPGESVLEILGENGVTTGVRTDKGEIAADMVLIAIGVRPNVNLAREAGLIIGPSGAIAVNRHMCTSDPAIYAGGDCVETFNRITGKPVRQPMGSTANRHGRVIADNIAERPTEFEGVIGSMMLKLFDVSIGRTGLSEKSARDAGFDPVSSTIVASDKPHFMPGSGSMVIHLTADRTTRRMLGAQLIGTGVVDKRLDVFATSIYAGQTVDELADVDLGYAPPFATALDPVTHAANALRNKMDGLVVTYSPSELQQRAACGESFVMLDVRTPQEVEQQGRLPFDETIFIPLGALQGRLAELPRDKEIIAFCKVSMRGWDACAILRGGGFDNIALLEGGVIGWPYALR